MADPEPGEDSKLYRETTVPVTSAKSEPSLFVKLRDVRIYGHFFELFAKLQFAATACKHFTFRWSKTKPRQNLQRADKRPFSSENIFRFS